MTKLWFKRKKYGWGWTPKSVEGWLVTLGLIAVVLALSFYFQADLDEGNGVPFFIALAFLIVAFIKLCGARGEKPKWSWGK